MPRGEGVAASPAFQSLAQPRPAHGTGTGWFQRKCSNDRHEMSAGMALLGIKAEDNGCCYMKCTAP